MWHQKVLYSAFIYPAFLYISESLSWRTCKQTNKQITEQNKRDPKSIQLKNYTSKYNYKHFSLHLCHRYYTMAFSKLKEKVKSIYEKSECEETSLV